MTATKAAAGKSDAAEARPGPSSPQQISAIDAAAGGDSALESSNLTATNTLTGSDGTLFINPALLTITPQHYEVDFWQSRRITQQLMTVDRTAFVMSTLNIYSGWNAAAGLQAAPITEAVLKALCVLYLLLSIAHQLHMKYKPEQYLRHRDAILLATRLARGAWMVAMFWTTPEVDIYNYFVAKRLRQGMSGAAVAVQLMSLFTLILLGQCLYYPMKFRHALALQLMYVGAVLATAKTVRCILQSPVLAEGTRYCCTAVRMFTEGFYVLLGLGKGDDPVMCGERSAEELFTSWMVCFALLLPLYVLYVKEWSEKQRFLQQKQMQQMQQQRAIASVQHNYLSSLGPALNLLPLLHVVGVSIVLMLGLASAEVLVGMSQPPVCLPQPYHVL